MGDDEGFEAYVAGRWSALVGTAFLVTGDRGLAEDCVQEALSRVHGRWRRLREGGGVDAYVRRCVVNAALSWRRRRRLQEVPLDVGRHEVAADGTPCAPLDRDLLAALRSLPPRMRAVVVLRHLEDCSEAETARLLGCSTGTVKSAASRGLGRLRAALEDQREGCR